MGYKCPVCGYTNKKWPGLRMHMFSKHKDEYPDGLPNRDEVEFVEDAEERAAPRGEEAITTPVFEDEQAQQLYNLLVLHGIKGDKSRLIAQLFSEVITYQNPQSLHSLLSAHLKGPAQAAIGVIVNELFPQQGGPNPIYTTGQYGYPYFGGGYGPSMPGYGSPPNPQVENRLNNIEKVLEKMIDEGDNRPNAELQAKVEELKAQLQDEKDRRQEDREKRRDEQTSQLMNQLQQQNVEMPQLIAEAYDKANREHTLREEARVAGIEEGRRTKSTDFEGRVLDIVENQAAPAFIGEVRAGRGMLETLTKKAASEESNPSPEPIDEEEAGRISEAMLIEERMREMASGKYKETVSEKPGSPA